MEPKVFGIGMPKTATSSLHTALELLGMKSIHFPHDKKTVQELEAGNYKLSLLDKYDAICDVPVPAIFAQLDKYWPDSKFILTVRDIDKWLDSCKHAPFNAANAIPKHDHFRYFYRTMLYGTIAFNRERFEWVYNRHTKQVIEHFSGEKAKQLLVLDITNGDGWEKLCEFLKVTAPDVEFPHSNPRLSETKSYKSHASKLKKKIKSIFD